MLEPATLQEAFVGRLIQKDLQDYTKEGCALEGGALRKGKCPPRSFMSASPIGCLAYRCQLQL